MRNDIVELVTQYKDGREIKENTVEIMAKKKSLGRNEFYAAYGVGLKASRIFVVNPSEYYLADKTVGTDVFHATHVKYEGKLHRIIRTYETSRFEMELTVE